MLIQELVNDITSKDTTRIRNSSSQIIKLKHNREFVSQLIDFLPQIKSKTKNLNLGGAFAPNIRFAEYAIRIIEFHKESKLCTCELFIDKYECNNPKAECETDKVKILNTILIEGNWVDFYIVECLDCCQKFKVIEREYHYTWWGWTKFEG